MFAKRAIWGTSSLSRVSVFSLLVLLSVFFQDNTSLPVAVCFGCFILGVYWFASVTVLVVSASCSEGL